MRTPRHYGPLVIPSMRTLGGEVVSGRWGRSLVGGGLSKSSSGVGVAVLVRCTAGYQATRLESAD
jgi:hypothetical protein